MASDQDFQPRLGTALATFTNTGTYSQVVYLNGRLIGMYSDTWPSTAGSVDIRTSWNASGTGYKVQTPDGTVLKLPAFAAGTMYSFGQTPNFTNTLGFTILQVGTAGTAGAAGGTIVLVTEQR